MADGHLAAQDGIGQAPPQLQAAIGHRLDPLQTERHLLELQRQGGGVRQRPHQPQAPLAAEPALASHPCLQLLHQQLLEVEQHRGLHALQGLADEVVFPLAEAQEAVGDRIDQAAAHQQPQVDAALAPGDRPSHQVGEEAQAIAAAGEAQLQGLAAGLQRQQAREIDGAGGAFGLQGQIHVEPLLLQIQPAPLQPQAPAGQLGLIQRQLHLQLRPPPAQSVATVHRQVAPQAVGHRRQQRQQRQGQSGDREAAASLEQRSLQPHHKGVAGQGQIPVLLAQPQVSAAVECGAGPAQIRSLEN